MSLSSIFNHVRSNIAICIGGSNVLSFKFRQQTLISLVESPRVTKAVNLTSSAEISLAGSISRGIRGGEKLAINGVLDGSGNILEVVSFCEDVATLTDLEGVAGVIVEVIVDL